MEPEKRGIPSECVSEESDEAAIGSLEGSQAPAAAILSDVQLPELCNVGPLMLSSCIISL